MSKHPEAHDNGAESAQRTSRPMALDEAQAVVDRARDELWPELRRAMYGVAAVSAVVAAGTVLVLLSLLAAAR